MKAWSEVEDELVTKCLNGDIGTASMMYRHINNVIYSKGVLTALCCAYPATNNVEVGSNCELDSDATLMRNVRVQIATEIYRGIRMKSNVINDKKAILFITYYLTYHWGEIMDKCMKKIASILSSPIVKFL